MESPVRSNTSGENPAQTDGAAAGTGSGASLNAQQQSVCQETTRQQFEAKSYLERQVEELSCADEDEAQEKVSKRLQLKHERARKKRQVVRCVRGGCRVGLGLIISHLQQNSRGRTLDGNPQINFKWGACTLRHCCRALLRARTL